MQVDVDVFPARGGDVFLLCSDGLTSMVHEAERRARCSSARRARWSTLGRELIAAANEAGGRDNITVILFRLEEVDGARRAPARPPRPPRRDEDDDREYDTFEGEAVPRAAPGRHARPRGVRDDEALRASEVADDGRGRLPRAAARSRCRRSSPRARRRAPEEPPPQPRRAHRAAPPRRPPGGDAARRAASAAAASRSALVVALVLVALVLVGVLARHARRLLRRHRPAATTARSRSTAGLPVRPAARHRALHSATPGSGVTLAAVPPARRKTFTDHKLRSKRRRREPRDRSSNADSSQP